MLGDILLITENHKKVAESIVNSLLMKHSDKYVIAIGGESGSGKSEIAHSIARSLKDLGSSQKILHIDDYYKIPPCERTDWRRRMGLQHIGLTEVDWDLIGKHIKEFRNNQEAVLPCIDLLTDQIDWLKTSFTGLKYLIVEGLYALNVDADLKTVIDITYRDTKKTQILRGKEKLDEFRLMVLKREHEVVRSLHYMANLVITKNFDVVMYKS